MTIAVAVGVLGTSAAAATAATPRADTVRHDRLERAIKNRNATIASLRRRLIASRRVSANRARAIRTRDAQIATLSIDSGYPEKLAAAQAEIGRLGVEVSRLTFSEATLSGDLRMCRTSVASLQAQVDVATQGVISQIGAMSPAQTWPLLEAIYKRFPTDFSSSYSASFFVSGTYQSYSFTHSP